MRFSWIPREQKFFDMFDETTGLIVKAAQVFADLVDNFDHCDRRVRDLNELENQCDLQVEMILKALGRTFITPFDREDIHELATRLDDVLDDMEEAAYRLTAFRIDKPTPEAIKMVLIIQEACRHMQKAVNLCRGKLASEEIAIELREISRLENEADVVFRDAEADLFANPPADYATFIKWKEIYEWLENTVDACRDVAHVINEIVVKGS
jgi:predicted phosphate transport protein (TIGR00153 family)